jgi:uncharacterized protein
MQAQDHVLHSSLECSIDKSPYVNIMEDGMIAPVTSDGTCNDGSPSNQTVDEVELNDKVGVIQQNEVSTEKHNEHTSGAENKSSVGSTNQQGEDIYSNKLREIIAPVKRSINQLTRYQGRSVWLLAYIAFVTSWPLIGSLAFITFRKRIRNSLRAQ